MRNTSQCGTGKGFGALACNGPKALLCAWQSVTRAADKLALEKCIAGTELSPVEACMSDKDAAACRAVLAGCMSDLGKDDKKALACYDGNEGNTLVEASAKEWNEAAPGKGYIPCVFVDGHGLNNATHCDVPTLVTYDEVKDALCAAGSKSPACSKYIEAALPDVA